MCPGVCLLRCYCSHGVQEVLIDGVWYSVSQDSPSCILVQSPSQCFGSAVCNTLGLAVGSGCEGRPRCEHLKELAVNLGILGDWSGLVQNWLWCVCSVYEHESIWTMPVVTYRFQNFYTIIFTIFYASWAICMMWTWFGTLWWPFSVRFIRCYRFRTVRYPGYRVPAGHTAVQCSGCFTEWLCVCLSCSAVCMCAYAVCGVCAVLCAVCRVLYVSTPCVLSCVYIILVIFLARFSEKSRFMRVISPTIFLTFLVPSCYNVLYIQSKDWILL